jgi:hypothetical protein
MIFDDFGHQAVDGAPRASDQSQHVGTADFLFECAFDSFNLAANPSHAVKQLGLLPSRIKHAPLLSTPDFPRNFLPGIGDINELLALPEKGASSPRLSAVAEGIQSHLPEKELKRT